MSIGIAGDGFTKVKRASPVKPAPGGGLWQFEAELERQANAADFRERLRRRLAEAPVESEAPAEVEVEALAEVEVEPGPRSPWAGPRASRFKRRRGDSRWRARR